MEKHLLSHGISLVLFHKFLKGSYTFWSHWEILMRDVFAFCWKLRTSTNVVIFKKSLNTLLMPWFIPTHRSRRCFVWKRTFYRFMEWLQKKKRNVYCSKLISERFYRIWQDFSVFRWKEYQTSYTQVNWLPKFRVTRWKLDSKMLIFYPNCQWHNFNQNQIKLEGWKMKQRKRNKNTKISSFWEWFWSKCLCTSSTATFVSQWFGWLISEGLC